MPPSQAIMLAEEKGLDLVEISATAAPPVCRIMNSGKFFYQQSKREAEARKHQRHIQVKEVKFRPKIDEHDFQFKLRNVERFLDGGNKVKSVVIFRGREVVHMEVGRRHLERLAQELSHLCNVESPPKKEGNTMVQILSPKKDAASKKAVAQKKAEASQKAEAKRAEAKKGNAKKADAKKAEPEAEVKKAEAGTSDAEQPRAEQPRAEQPKAEQPKAEQPAPAKKAAAPKKTAAPKKAAEEKPAAAKKAASKAAPASKSAKAKKAGAVKKTAATRKTSAGARATK